MRSRVLKKAAWEVWKAEMGSVSEVSASASASGRGMSPFVVVLLFLGRVVPGGVARARIAEERWTRREAVS